MRTTLSRTAATLALLSCAATVPAAPEAERLVLRLEGVERNDYRPPVVTAVAISPDGRRVAAGGDDHQVRVWDADSGDSIQTLDGHEDWVRAARFSGDGSLVTVGCDHSVCLWDLGTQGRRLVSRRLTQGSLQTVAWRPDGKGLATAGYGDSLRLFDLSQPETAPQELGCACIDTRAVAFSPDGRWVAAAGRNGVIRVWDLVASGGPRDLATDGRRVRALAFSTDGETLAAGGDGPAVRLWRRTDAGFGGPDELLVRPGKVHSLAFLNERLLSIGDTRNEIHVWDADTRSPRMTLRGHTGTVAALAASADGSRLVSGSFDTTVRVWDLELDGLPAASTASTGATTR